MRTCSSILFILLALCPPLSAETPEFAPAITEITAFKDGHALVRAEGEARLEDGWCRLKDVPAPLLGMFWAYVQEPGASVDLVRAGMEDWTKEKPCLNLDEMLKANAGKKVRLAEQIPGGPTVVTEGTLLPPAEYSGKKETETSRSVSSGYDEYGRWLGNPQVRETREEDVRNAAAFISIRTDQGVRLIKRENVVNLSILDGAPVTMCQSKESRRTLALHAVDEKSRPLKEAKLGILYLQKGLRWIPGYRIELKDSKTAKLVLNAELVNDLADFSGTDLKLVVGVPSFLMKDTLSPLALREANLQLSSYLNPPGAGGRVNAFANQVMSQAAMPVGDMAAPAEGPNIPDEGQREDLFIFKKAGVSLKKGDRALIPILETEAPYEDIYAWDIPPVPPKEAWQNINRGDQRDTLSALTGTQAMHKVRLTNTGAVPWTTGPASLFKGGTPLAQQMMTYTSPKNTVEIPVTTATDLNTKKLENETGRQPNIRINNTDYTKVAMKGTLTVTNFKAQDAKVKVIRKVIGTASTTSSNGKTVQSNALEDTSLGLALYPWYSWNWPWWLWSVNPVSIITWEVTIPAGQSATVEYEYSYLFHPY
jgi:hypothetical protein